ncbi:MAG TPA: universal stress protein [Puia sp.]|nr:universal stress protein [Puia sp.]
MKKIIAAFDGLRFSKSTMQYAAHLAQLSDAHLVGVFLSEATRLSYAVYATIAKQSFTGKNIFDEIDRSDAVAIKESMDTFESECRGLKISYTLHRDKKNAIHELIHETVFADLLVIDAWETFSYLENRLPGWFIRNILHDAQCPVLVVPKKFQPVKKLIFLYNGTPSAVHAIKMFNYIFPEMNTLEAELLCAKEDNLHLPDNKLLKEWTKSHYNNLEYKVMKGKEREIVTILTNEDPGSLVIAGAYDRSYLSMWFHESLADLLLRETRVPIFIAHT